MSKFLTRSEIYRILQRELPEGLYPDGTPALYYSTADNDAVAQNCASAYDAMEKIYNNLFAVTADEQLDQWEILYFGATQTGALTTQQRRNQLLAKIRTRFEISYWQIFLLVNSFFPGSVIEIRQRSKQSILTKDLKGDLSDLVWAPGWISGNPAPAGVTVTDDIRNTYASLLALRDDAFRYDVIIWDSNVTDVTLLDKELSAAEPARSAHTITLMPTVTYETITEMTRFNAEKYNVGVVDTGVNSGYSAVKNTGGGDGFYFGFEGDPSADTFSDNGVGGGIFYFVV